MVEIQNPNLWPLVPYWGDENKQKNIPKSTLKMFPKVFLANSK
jgi:hypothetical protein